MQSAIRSISQSGEHVKSVAGGASVPSVHLYGQSSAWTRQQRRIYGRCLSWMREASGRGCQLLWVMLSTAEGGDAGKLGRHFQELRRRMEKRFSFYVEFFKVETGEGNGVLHMLWAIKRERPVYISQKWLSREWESIHGARVVWISRITQGPKSTRNVAKYLVSQYLGGQCALIRVSWSWKRARLSIGKAWCSFRREWRRGEHINPFKGMTGWCMKFSRHDMFDTWDKILRLGECSIGVAVFTIFERSVRVAYGG